MIDLKDTEIYNMSIDQKLINKYTRFLLDADLTHKKYEYFNHDNVIFILGLDKMEKELPPLLIPTKFKSIDGDIMVIDLRQYTSSNKVRDVLKVNDYVSNINEVLSDVSGASIDIMYGLVRNSNLDYLKAFRTMYIYLVTLMVVSKVAKSSQLNADEVVRLHLIVGVHYNYLYGGEMDIEDTINSVLRTMRVKLSIDEAKVLLDTIYENGMTLTNLVDNIKNGLNTPKVNGLTTSLLLHQFNGYWFGYRADIKTRLLLEDPIMGLVLLNAGNNSKSFRQTMLGRFVLENKKLIPENLDSILNMYVDGLDD